LIVDSPPARANLPQFFSSGFSNARARIFASPLRWRRSNRKKTRASPLPVSDAFWIRLNEVVPSGRTPHNSRRDRPVSLERCDRRCDRLVFMRPVEAGAGQQPNRAPVQPGMQAVPVVFDFVQPFRSFRGLVDELVSCGLTLLGSAVAAVPRAVAPCF